MFGLFSRKTLFWRLLPLLLLAPLLTAGNDRSETTPPDPKPNPVTLPQVLHVGLIPEQAIFTQLQRYQPLLDYLAQELGIKIEMHILPRFGNLIDNFNQLGLDAAFFGSFTGALAIRKLGVVPLARPQFIGGRSTYYGLVFVRRDSGIRTAADMKGKRMVFVDRATTAGYLLPLAFFNEIGISNYSEWFREYYFAGTHEDAISEVLNGYADVGAAENTVFDRLAARDPRLAGELEILATSPPLPAGGLAVRKDLPEELQKSLQQKLLTMHQSLPGRIVLEGFGAEKFLRTTAADYLPVLDYAAGIGIDMTTYQYQND
jgi:phosphonate transport system substrate-binding protein